MWLTKEHIGKKVKHTSSSSNFVFLVEALDEIFVYGTTYYDDGCTSRLDMWANTDHWELVEAPTTSFILED